MLNKNSNSTVEAIVAKYVTAVKVQWEATSEYKDLHSSSPYFDISPTTEFAFAPHQQLLATLWSEVNGHPEDGKLLGELTHYIGFFNRNILSEEEMTFLVSNYRDTVNHIFTLRDEWLWLESSLFEYREGMCDLVAKLLDFKPGDSLYIPFVEYGDLAVRFPECKISGNVSPDKYKTWAFCCIRLEANGISYDIPYPNSGHPQKLPVPEEGSVDCLICDNCVLLYDFSSSIPELYASLKPMGRMVYVASPYALGATEENEMKFRKQIIKDKVLKAVVQLPFAIFRPSDEALYDSCFVMCIDKRENDNAYNEVVFADATGCDIQSNQKNPDVGRLVDFVLHKDASTDENVCKFVTYDKVDAEILLPAYYLVKKPSLAMMGLNHVLKMADMDSSIATGTIPAVTVKDLTMSFEKANLSIPELSPLCEFGNKTDFAIVKKPCVFLCSNGERILVGYISEVPETGIAVSKIINCFDVVNADVVSATLLLLEDYVSRQIMAMSVGKIIRMFDDNLLSKVKVLPLVYDTELSWELELDAIKEQQRLEDDAVNAEIVENAKMQKVVDEWGLAEVEEDAKLQSMADAITLKEAEEDAKLQKIADEITLEELKRESQHQRDRMQKKLYDTIEFHRQESVNQYEEYRKSVRLRKHALTQSLSSYGAMFKALMNCRKRQCGFLDDKDRLSDISDLTVADAFAYLESRLGSIQQKLAAIADVEEDFGRPEAIEPIEFINSYIEGNKAGWLRFSAETDWEVTNRASKDIPDLNGDGFVLRKGDPIYTFSFPKKALIRIFDNIIANAVAHGFTDSSRGDYKVRFSWKISGMDMTVIIENNGKSISNEVDTSDILKYGFSTSLNTNGHNGIGCSEIANIMRDYDGEVKVVSTPDETYTVKYILTFKRSNVVGILKL